MLEFEKYQKLPMPSQDEIKEYLKKLSLLSISPKFKCEQKINGSFIVNNRHTEVYLRDAKELKAF